MTENDLKNKFKHIKGAEIKLVTYNDMYYTYAKIDENTDCIVDYKELENTNTSLGEKIYNCVNDSLDMLKYQLETKTFIHCYGEQKILNCKEIKETIVNYFYDKIDK